VKSREETEKKTKVPKPAQVRITISFPPQLHQQLEAVAKKKKVSYAWAVREAVEKYVKRWPDEQQALQAHERQLAAIEKLREEMPSRIRERGCE
jgi:metal-responsive CopG/Arc/MetJ family transcriptional regulator